MHRGRGAKPGQFTTTIYPVHPQSLSLANEVKALLPKLASKKRIRLADPSKAVPNERLCVVCGGHRKRGPQTREDGTKYDSGLCRKCWMARRVAKHKLEKAGVVLRPDDGPQHGIHWRRMIGKDRPQPKLARMVKGADGRWVPADDDPV